jgi:HEAT repeat protein
MEKLSHVIFSEELFELQKLIPSLKKLRSHVEEPPAQEARRRLFSGFINLLCEISRQRPLIILFDELHWIDAGTLSLITHLLRIQRGNIIFSGALREDYPQEGIPLGDFLSQLRVTDSFRLIVLEPLSSNEISEMISAIFPGRAPDPIFDETLHEITKGNPLFIEETLKTLVIKGRILKTQTGWVFREVRVDDLPASLEETIRDHIETLDEETRKIVANAAVIGPNFRLDLLKGIIEKGEAETLELLDRARRLRLIGESIPLSTEEHLFLSSTLQEFNYQQLDEQSRRETHYKIGRFEEERSKDDPSSVANLLAYHFRRSSDPVRAEKYEKMLSNYAEALYRDEEVKTYHGLERIRTRLEESKEELDEELLSLVGGFLRVFLVAIKNIQFYPPGSILVSQSQDALEESLSKLFKKLNALTLKDERGKFFINTTLLKKGEFGGMADEIFRILQEHFITSLTIAKGFSRREIQRLLEALSQPAEKGSSDPYYWDKFLDEHKIAHIDILQRTYVREEKPPSETTIRLRRVEMPLDDESMLLMRDVLRYFCASVENIKLYPSESRLIGYSMELLEKSLAEIFKRVESFTFSQVRDAFLINGVRANPKILGASIHTLLRLLKDNMIKSCTIVKGVDAREISLLLYALAGKGDKGASESWDRFLRSNNVRHIGIDQKIYEVAESVQVFPKVSPPEEKRLPRVSLERRNRARLLLEGPARELLVGENLKELPQILETLFLEREEGLGRLLIEKFLENLGDELTQVRLDAANAFSELLKEVAPFVKVALVDSSISRISDAVKVENNFSVYEKLLVGYKELLLELKSKDNLYALTNLVRALSEHSPEEKIEQLRRSTLEELLKNPSFSGMLDELEGADAEKELLLAGILEGFAGVLAPFLIEKLKSSESPHLREKLARLLGKTFVEAKDLLLRELTPFSEESEVVRILSVIDLICEDPSVFLRNALEHQSQKVCRETFNVIKRQKKGLALGLLKELLAEQRHLPTTIIILGELRYKEVIPDLIEILKTVKDPNIKKECCISLGKIADESAIPPLLEEAQKKGIFGIMERASEQVRVAATWALGNFKENEEVKAVLKKLAEDKNSAVRAQAKLALR